VHFSEPRRSLPRAASVVLLSVAVGVLSVPAAKSAAPPSRPASAPTDLYRGQQWTLGALHIPRAWKYSRGNGVTVAVLDTGVDGHQPDLAGRVIDGPDFTGHTRKPGGKYWGRHGTEMASLVAGHGHGPGAASGVMGVAPEAKILSIRVTWELNDPIRNDHGKVDRSRDAVANGIRYAVDHGAQVISMSLGGGNLFYNGNAAEEAAVKYAIGKGVVLVASAGNDGSGANRRNYPAAYPGVIAVGAVDRAFRPAKFTNRHTYISVAAPGVEIVSADVTGHGYILGTGTSSSAAFVAGMGALVKARYPRLTSAEVKQALEEGTTHRPPDGRSSEIGTGVADAFGALRTAGRINKAEHGGAAVVSQQPPPAAPPPAKHGPDLMLIAVLSGGGTLIVLSLILGWRQRRRRAAAEYDDEDVTEPPPPVPVRTPVRAIEPPARDHPPPAAPGARLSPWERRPADTPSPLDESSWERRPPAPQWGEHRPAEWELSDSVGETTHWDGPSSDSSATNAWFDPKAPADAWPRQDAEPPAAPWNHPAPETPADAWPRQGAEPPAGASDQPTADVWPRQETEPSGGTWDDPLTGEPAPDAWPREESKPSGGTWDPLTGEPAPDAWARQETEPSGGTWAPQAGEPAPDAWARQEAEAPNGTWDRPAAEPSERSDAEAWDRYDAQSPTGTWDHPTTDAWGRYETEPPANTWDPPADAPEQSEPAGWERYDAQSPTGTWDHPTTQPPTGDTEGVGSPEPYEPPGWTHADGNGHVPPDAPPPEVPHDPLTDEIDSSDTGTPLADESWDSIRRGFDRLKDASTWESLASEDLGGKEEPAADAFDETASIPVIDPDDDGKN
jgi:serine protease